MARHTLIRPIGPLLGGLLALLCAARPVAAFDFEDVAALALKQARAPYRVPASKQPAELEALTYDQYRDIRFRPDHALWRADNLPFEVMFFHVGKANERVRMNEVAANKVRHLPYDSADFDYGKNTLSPEKWGDLDFGGLRVHYPLNGPQYKD
ncbi:MAG TPA: glucan biosynthesis protein, partial [Gammaproteobacteria bacterium]|nr:glucan biosynthesis protein [Gammaproteobacteria bacterium]